MALTMSQLAKSYNVTRQAIYLKIKQGRLKAEKRYGRWFIEEKDYLNFIKTKYTRIHDEDFLYSEQQGFFSVKKTSQILDCPEQCLYYRIRSGFIKSFRHKSSLFMHISDIMKFKDYLLAKNYHQRPAVLNKIMVT